MFILGYQHLIQNTDERFSTNGTFQNVPHGKVAWWFGFCCSSFQNPTEMNGEVWVIIYGATSQLYRSECWHTKDLSRVALLTTWNTHSFWKFTCGCRLHKFHQEVQPRQIHVGNALEDLTDNKFASLGQFPSCTTVEVWGPLICF